MAITGRTPTVVEDDSATTITGTLPTDRVTGDLVIATFSFTGDVTGSLTGPSGWTQVHTPTAFDTTNYVTLASYYRFDPPADPTASHSAAAGALSVICQAYGGVNTTTPLDVTSVVTTAASTSVVATGVTTATNGARLISMHAEDNRTRTAVIPSGMTQVIQYSAAGGTTGGRHLAMADEVRATAGATGTRTWSNSPSNTNNMIAVVGALRPATDATMTPSAVATVTSVKSASMTNGNATMAPAKIATTTTVPAATMTATPPAFPLVALPISTALYLDGATATDITAYTYGRETPAVRIKRGRSAEGGAVETQTMDLLLDNRDGRFSPRNPTGPYFGQLKRNTLLALDIDEGGPSMYCPAVDGSFASTADSAALSITGDIDIRVDLYANNWGTAGNLVSKYESVVGGRSYALGATTGGVLYFFSSADGTTPIVRNSTINPPLTGPGRMAVRVTLDVDNGAGGNTVTFYTASTINGPWRQLGDPVVTAGTTSIFDNNRQLRVGDAYPASGAATSIDGYYYEAQVRNGIDGTLVANPVFADQAVNVPSFVDDQGNTWSFSGSALLTQFHARLFGEVSEWPQQWDPTGSDAWVPVRVSGITRRLGQGVSPVASVLRHTIPARADLVAYWPCEDGANARSIASGTQGVRAMVVTDTTASGGTAPAFASNTAFKASDAIPVLNTGRFDAIVPTYSTAGEQQFRFLINVPSGGTTDLAQICKLYTSGTAAKWEMIYGVVNGGSIQLNVYDRNDATISTGSFVSFALDGKAKLLHFELTQSGGNVDWVIAAIEPGARSGTTSTGTVTSRTVGIVNRFVFNKHNDIGGTAIGHVHLENAITSVFDYGVQLNAYLGETAGNRMQRLAGENGESIDVVGDPDDTHRMGYQGVDTFLNLVKECAETDGGILYEPRDVVAMRYRTRRSLERQNPKVTLSYPGHQMVKLEPTEDDRDTRNKVTVSRRDGGSAVAELTTGSLSTQSPPDGVGRYDTSVTLSLSNDVEAERQAYWRLHLGTVDEARYPRLRVNLASPDITADQRLVRELLDLDVGDRITIDDPPLWVPPEAISLLVQGYTEEIGQFHHVIEFNLAPESPYRVAVYDDGASRYSSDGSTLDGAHNSTTTTLSVATASGPTWRHTDGDFDIMVAGERMTVTNITGTTSPQTFTVTRSVNGVVKAQASGATVELFEPYYYAL